MKWKDLSLKERKQIYDAVIADNPNATYFDIKKEFDTIPEYEEGGKIKLPPENVPGTPEYFARQKRISGSVESDKINKSMLDPYFDPRNSSNYINEVSRNMYDLYRNKQGFVNRMNMLVPMEYAAPIGITGLAGYELNKE